MADDPRPWVQNVPVLDLSGVRDPKDAAGLRLKNVALVLVPEDMPGLLAGAECRNIGAVLPVPAGTRVESRSGQVEMPGNALASGDPNTILAIMGQVVIPPPIPSVGYHSLVLSGQIFLPKSAQAALGAKILHSSGQIMYYDDDAPPRLFLGNTRLTKAFLEQFQDPMTLVLVGNGTIAADVTPDLLRTAVRRAMIVGHVTVENPNTAPVLQFLAHHLIGGIDVAADDDEDDEDDDEDDDEAEKA